MRSILISLLLFGCAREGGNYINPVFLPYIREFNKICAPTPTNLVIGFGDLDGDVLAHCLPSFTWITVDEKKWNGSKTEDWRLWVIFHELGHCVLDRDHDTSYNETCPTSIMFPYQFGDSKCFQENRDYYIKELCDGH